MDKQVRAAIALLNTLARSSERLLGFSRAINARSTVASTANVLTFRDYLSGSMLEAYVDAELKNGEALGWTLDVTWGAASWVIRYGVSRNDATGYHRIVDFDERTAETLDAFLSQLDVAVSGLIGSASTIDF